MQILERTSFYESPVELCVLSCNKWDISQRFLKHLVDHTEYGKYHLVWIDNGSNDGTSKHITKYWQENDSNMTLILNDTNEGIIGGRNQGFDHFLSDKSNGQYLMFLDNDQFVQNNWLDQHLEVMKNGYDMIGVEAWQMGRNFMPTKRNLRISEWFSYVGCGGMTIDRKLVEAIGKFDEQFNPCYFEDPDYCFRANDAGYKIGWNIRANIHHLGHQTLGSSQDRAGNLIKSLQKFRKKWQGSMPPMLIQKKLDAFEM